MMQSAKHISTKVIFHRKRPRNFVTAPTADRACSTARSRCIPSCLSQQSQEIQNHYHTISSSNLYPAASIIKCRHLSTEKVSAVGYDDDVMSTVVSTDKSGDVIFSKNTQRILECPLGSFDSHTWFEAERTVHYWNRQRTLESVQYSMTLLDRFLQEYCHQSKENDGAVPLPTVLTTANLNFTVNNWQLCAKSLPTAARRASLPNPTELLEKIDAFVGYYKTEPAIAANRNGEEHLPLQANIYTYSMVLDALAFSQPDQLQSEYEVRQELGVQGDDLKTKTTTTTTNKDSRGNIGWTYLETPAPILAEMLLHRLLDESQSNQYLRPTIVTFNSVINVWGRSRLPEAPEKAEELLRQVLELGSLPDWNGLTPTNSTYASIVHTWGRSKAAGAPARAQVLLKEVKGSNDPDVFPNSELYLGVLKTFGQGDDPQAAAHANTLLQDLISEYQLELSKQLVSPTESAVTHLQELKPSVLCFLAVMNIYASKGDAEGADALLEQLQALYEESNYDMDLCPNTAAFNTVIRALGKSESKNAPALAKAMVQRMQELAESTDNSDLYPDVDTYNSFLHVLSSSKAGDALQQAEEVFQNMQESPGIEPDVYTYNIVLHVMAQSQNIDAAGRSEAFLRTFWDRYNSGTIDFKPDATAYNTCIDACKVSQLNANHFKRAESLFCEMQDVYKDTGDAKLKPTRYSYGSMIAVCSRARHGGGAKRAQQYFDEMIATGVQPTIVEYNATIHAWAKVGGVEQAESLVNRALEDFHNGNKLAKPDVKSFSSVLNALAKRKSRDAWGDACKAEAILVHMEEMSKTLGPGVKPNEFAFNAVLDCFAKCRKREDAAEHAEAILSHMRALHDAGNQAVKPSVISVTTVMNCWAYSNSPRAPTRVENLFRYLIDQFAKTGDEKMKPSQYTYNALIGAFARCSARSDAVGKAMGHFNNMVEQYQNTGDEDIRPGPMHFSVILSALAKRGMAEEAEQFLEQVLSICRKHHAAEGERLEIASSFNNLISAHARSNLPGSAEQAEKALRRMQQLGPVGDFIEAEPTVVSYTSVMMAWSRVTAPEEKAIALAKCEHILEEMLQQTQAGKRHLMPNAFTFGTLLQVLSRSDVSDKKERAMQILQFMKQYNVQPDPFVLTAAKHCVSTRA